MLSCDYSSLSLRTICLCLFCEQLRPELHVLDVPRVAAFTYGLLPLGATRPRNDPLPHQFDVFQFWHVIWPVDPKRGAEPPAKPLRQKLVAYAAGSGRVLTRRLQIAAARPESEPSPISATLSDNDVVGQLTSDDPAIPMVELTRSTS